MHSINEEPEVKVIPYQALSDIPDDDVPLPVDPDDTLNLNNGLRNEKYAPEDRFNLALIIMVFLGMGGMYPWNFFITAAGYFQYSLRDADHPDTTSTYQRTFENALALISTGTGVLALAFNTAITRYVSFKGRVYCGLAVILIVFVATTVIASENTDTWQQGFFIVTMIDVFIINFASNIVNGALFGVLGSLPARFSTGMMVGQGLAGIFAALCSVLSVVSSPSDGGDQSVTIKHEAVAYFASAVTATFLCILAFTFFLRLPIISFYTAPVVVVAVVAEVPVAVVKERVPLGLIIKRTWHHAATLVLTFGITLSLFPSIATQVRSTEASSASLVTNRLFLPLACFVVFNAGDLSGRLAHGFVQWPNPQQGWLTFVFSLLRFAFIPLLLYCNIVPRSHMSSVFGDAVFVAVIAGIAFSNGYLGNLGIMYGAKLVPPEHAETTGSMMGLCINLGLLSGAAFSFALLYAV